MHTNSKRRLRTHSRPLSAATRTVPQSNAEPRTAPPRTEPAPIRDVRDAERQVVAPDSTHVSVVIDADVDLDLDLEMDTAIMPVVGDQVHYSRGSGYLIGLQGVVVTDDHEPDLPPGLRYVLFDGEDWPNVVGVGNLDRA
jgi:hypothetical protein